jgi:glycosyltransferase involved in cell wall biosynthesis
MATISVILPYRNASETLDAALLGLLARDDASVEVLAVDDGSTDGGAARVAAWAARDARVRSLRAGGAGLVAALNLGLAHASGELIARMDGDDLCHPTRLHKQRDYLERHPEIAVLGTLVEGFVDGAPLSQGLGLYIAWQNALVTPEDHQRELFVESPLCHPSVMMRRRALEGLGGYRDGDGPEDYDLWLRFDAASQRLAKLPEVLLRWRHRAGRATFSDPRYALSRMREAKAPFLARRLLQQQRERLVAWGAGPTGRRMMRELEKHGVRADAFVDIDPAKIGRVARGAPILSADGLDASRDTVVAAVGARGARTLIREELSRRGFIEGEHFWFAA